MIKDLGCAHELDRTRSRGCYPSALAIALLLTQTARPAVQNLPASAEFMRQAAAVLPVEERYQYHKSFLAGSIHEMTRDPDAKAEANELSLAEGAWRIVTRRNPDPLVRYACEDTVEFFAKAMQVAIEWQQVESLEEALESRRTIVVGQSGGFRTLPGELADLGLNLQKSKDYGLRTNATHVFICGFDAAGVMHGLFNFQARLNLREGPYLPHGLSVVRHSRYQTRMVLSWLGWMQWPDKYLASLAHDGYDAIFASVYANPNGVPGPPHYDLIRQQDAGRLNNLIERARRFGIRVYAPILWGNTDEEENKQRLREHVRDIVAKFPEIRGYVLLTEGFYYKKFFGAGGHGDQSLHEWARHWSEAVGIVAEECHKLDPSIEILPWEYNIDFRPNRVEIKRHVISLLPKTTIPLLTWENGKAFELDGFQGYLRDYSISRIGPAEVAAGQIEEARQRSMKVYCKTDCFATWQFGTTPYLPCPQQWQRRYEALAEYGVDGTLETWSNGYKPNFVAQLRAWSCWTNQIPEDTLLRMMARSLFGPDGANDAIAAWQHFSEAIQLVPDTGPSMGTNNAVAHPLFFEPPPSRIMTMHNSWWDEEKKTPWRHRMIDAWPFCHRIMVFLPDFTNRQNVAEQYARARSGIAMMESPAKLRNADVLPVFNKYLLQAADRLEVGLQHYRKAALSAPDLKQVAAFKEVMVVEQMQRMLRSLHAILAFEDARFRLHNNGEARLKSKLLDEMIDIVQDEIERTELSLLAAERDSRLGYESEMDYVYTPFVIRQKLDVLRETLDRQIPEFRANLEQTNQ